jgi:hypothetical protein
VTFYLDDANDSRLGAITLSISTVLVMLQTPFASNKKNLRCFAVSRMAREPMVHQRVIGVLGLMKNTSVTFHLDDANDSRLEAMTLSIST